MKKNIILTLAVLFSGAFAFAQSADQTLKAIINQAKSYKNIEIAFDYRMTNEEAGIDETMAGAGFLQGDSFKISLDNQEMISDGNVVWTYLPDEEEVMVSDIASDGSSSPLAILASYQDNVKASFVKNNSSDDLQTLEVKATNGDKKFDKIHICIRKADLQVASVSMFDDNGNTFTYNITKFVTNQDFPENFFVFDETAHPGVEVIDMR